MAVKKKVPAKKVPAAQGDPTFGPFLVSQSVINAWRRCEQLYDYRYVQLLERRRPVLQLIRGTMIGKCLDAIAGRRINPKAPTWQATLAPYEKQYGKLFREEKEYYGDIIGEVKRIVSKYEVIYANDGFKYHLGSDGRPYEITVLVELSPGIVFTGHIDKYPKDKEGRYWDMDHKSHKNIPLPEDRYADLQQVFYMWAAPLSGLPKATGVIWDYLRTKPPSIPEQLKNGELSKRKNMDTDYDTYMGEVTRLKLNPKDYKEILDPLKKRGTFDFFQRVRLPMPPKALIENVVEDARTTAIKIHKHGGVRPVRSINKMECPRCEFYHLCQAEFRGMDASFIRKSEYQIQKEPRHDHSKQKGV